MTNLAEDGLTYHGPVSFGIKTDTVEPQVLSVVYDTGSDWLAVEGSRCSDCQGKTYDHMTSMSAQGKGV